MKTRTLTQNKALHLYFSHLAEELNDSGLTVMKTLRHAADIPWSGKTVKELIWRPIMKIQLGKESTTDMTTKDIDKVLETITRHLAEKFDLVVDFPSIESQLSNERIK